MLSLLLRNRQKLQPFFAPLIPLQSINLRAALSRTLNGLVKDAVLERGIVVRKIMLDECKEEEFEEVLAAFSTIVPHKLLSTDNPPNGAIARRLVLKPKLKFDKGSSLLPLATAHRGSLTK